MGGTEKLANKFGLCDMHGNVSEWCWDFYDMVYSRSLPNATTDPRAPQSGRVGNTPGPYRVVRGGSCGTLAPGLRSAARNWIKSREHKGSRGFRVARNQSGTEQSP